MSIGVVLRATTEAKNIAPIEANLSRHAFLQLVAAVVAQEGNVTGDQNDSTSGVPASEG